MSDLNQIQGLLIFWGHFGLKSKAMHCVVEVHAVIKKIKCSTLNFTYINFSQKNKQKGNAIYVSMTCFALFKKFTFTSFI